MVILLTLSQVLHLNVSRLSVILSSFFPLLPCNFLTSGRMSRAAYTFQGVMVRFKTFFFSYLAIQSPHPQNVEGQLTSPFDLRVPNLVTFCRQKLYKQVHMSNYCLAQGQQRCSFVSSVPIILWDSPKDMFQIHGQDWSVSIKAKSSSSDKQSVILEMLAHF